MSALLIRGDLKLNKPTYKQHNNFNNINKVLQKNFYKRAPKLQTNNLSTTFSQTNNKTFSTPFFQTKEDKIIEYSPYFIQKRTKVWIHPLFTNALLNLKKKIYYWYLNWFLPPHQRYDLNVYRVWNWTLYGNYARHFQYHFSRMKLRMYQYWNIYHPRKLRLFGTPYFKMSIWRFPHRPGRRRKIFHPEAPERKRQIYPNTIASPYDRAGKPPGYNHKAHHLMNLANKYYFAKMAGDDLYDEDSPRIEKFLKNRKLKHYRAKKFHSHVTSKPTKTMAVIEGTYQFKYLSHNIFTGRFLKKFPFLLTLKRAFVEYWKMYTRRTYSTFKLYRGAYDPKFAYRDLRAVGKLIKRRLIYALDKGDPIPFIRCMNPEFLNKDLWKKVWRRIFGNEFHYYLLRHQGFILQKTLRCGPVRLRKMQQLHDTNNIAFGFIFTRRYSPIKKKELRTQSFRFKVIYDPEIAKFSVVFVKVRSKRRRMLW